MGTSNQGLISFQIDNANNAVVCFDRVLFTPEAIKATAYKMADRCNVSFANIDEYGYTVVISPIYEHNTIAVKEIVEGFQRELLDQQLREDISAKTDNLRKVITEHAFSSAVLAQKKRQAK